MYFKDFINNEPINPILSLLKLLCLGSRTATSAIPVLELDTCGQIISKNEFMKLIFKFDTDDIGVVIVKSQKLARVALVDRNFQIITDSKET